MPDIYESKGVFRQVIRNFSGGMLDDKRIQSPVHFSTSKWFDAFTYQTKLIPYGKRFTSLGLGGGVVTTLKLTRFLYAPNGASYKLWALGDDGAGTLKVFKFDIDGATDLDVANWVAATNGVSGAGTRSETVFAYYKGFIYMYQGTTDIAKFDTTEVAAFVNSWKTIDDSTIGVQPVHHPTDDVLYFFGAQNVYSLNNVTWNGSVQTVPNDMQIQAACAFGNYLAIGCTTKGNFDKRTIIFLWDRDSSVNTYTERIDMGEGTLLHLATLNNMLIAIMGNYPSNAFVVGKGKVMIKTPSGQFATTLAEIQLDTLGSASDFPISNMVRDNKLYFPMKATLNGDTRIGIWAVDQNGRMTIDQIEPALDTHANASAIRGIYATANLWWIAYDDGSGGVGAYSVTRTDKNSSNHYDTTNPAIWESLILSTIFITGRGVVIENNNVTKKLIGVQVHCEGLPTGASVIMKYRVDGATAWTTIFTYSTVGGTQHTAINIESSGANFPNYNEIEFRIESLGGAVITGMEYGGETIDNDLY